jgi:hypothetical protein
MCSFIAGHHHAAVLTTRSGEDENAAEASEDVSSSPITYPKMWKCGWRDSNPRPSVP